MLAKTNDSQLGSASISTVRRAIIKGATQCYRVEIMQDFISNNYSRARRNIEGAFFSVKELIDIASKARKAYVVLMIDS